MYSYPLSISWCVMHHTFIPCIQAYVTSLFFSYIHILSTHSVFTHHVQCHTHMSSFIHVFLIIHIITHIHALDIFLNQCYHYLSVHTIFSIVIIICQINLSYQSIHLTHYLIRLSIHAFHLITLYLQSSIFTNYPSFIHVPLPYTSNMIVVNI